MAEVNQPFSDKVSRNFFPAEVQAEYICNLGGEDSDGDTACKTYDDRIGYELDNRSQLEYPQQDKDNARHERGDNQPRLSVLLDNAVDNDDERAGRPANLYFATPQQRDDEAGDNSVMIPFSGDTPDAIPNAMASGKATIPTMIPAIRSAIKSSFE